MGNNEFDQTEDIFIFLQGPQTLGSIGGWEKGKTDKHEKEEKAKPWEQIKQIIKTDDKISANF